MHGGTHRITRRICTETKNAIPSGQRYIVPPIYLKNFCKGEDRKCFLYPNALLTFFLLVNCYKVLHFERPPAVGLNVVVSDRLTAIRSARPFDCRRHLVQRARRLSQCTVRFLVGEPHHAGPHPLRHTVELPRLRKTHGEGFAHRAEQVPRPTHNRLQIVSFHSLY